MLACCRRTREYIWLPETEIAPTMGSRTVVDRPVAVVDAVSTAPVVWQVHVDHLNRPIRMTDAAKASVWDVVWAPWGNVYSISGTANLDARFPGQWYQLAARMRSGHPKRRTRSGLHYNWHRHYDPTLGRYTQPDPLGFVDGPSVYGYAGGNPQSEIDPSGENLKAAEIVIKALQLAKWCVQNPGQCRADIVCPALEQAKNISCAAPGCKPSTLKISAHGLMRAAEACLASRDAIVALCPLTATKKHQTPWPVERQMYENKARKCQEACDGMRIYPWGG